LKIAGTRKREGGRAKDDHISFNILPAETIQRWVLRGDLITHQILLLGLWKGRWMCSLQEGKHGKVETLTYARRNSETRLSNV